VLALLQQEKRMSYRVLKRQLQQDDDTLEDLTEDLIYAKRLARDEEGKVLVWMGDAESLSASAPTPAHPPEIPADQTCRVDSLPSEPYAPEAERRHLTVLFCDLVDSTMLASQLDPEKWRDVVRAYQDTCATVIARLEGYIAQYLGDGLLVYFGWPHAHEGDARRAVQASLDILTAMETLNTYLERDQELRLAVRVGIHTGLVVVGEMGSSGRHEQLALGDTPHLAARLQGLAAPNAVVISVATHRLVQGYFTAAALGPQVLKGMATPVSVYHILAASAAQSRLEVAAATGWTPLVGRESDVALLLERWKQSQAGQGQVVLLSGEGGIGKSRLVEVLRQRVVGEGSPGLALRCSPYHTNSVLYPVIEHLQRVLAWRHDETPAATLDMLERTWEAYGLAPDEAVPLMAALLSVPIPEWRYPPVVLTPAQRRQRTMDTLTTWLLAETEQHPVVAVWEDLHWADPSTLELLGLMIDQVPTARMLTLVTARPEFRPPWAPRSHLTQLTLGRLPRAQYLFKHALIQETAYQSLLKSTRQQYHQRSAQVLTAQFPEVVETQPELVVQHYTEAGLTEQAVVYWQRAGQQALQHSANPEAVRHLTTGLALLAMLPDTPERAQQELNLQLAMGPALSATKGRAAREVEQTYARARALCQQVGETPQLFPTLGGLCGFYQYRGSLTTARELGEQLYRLVQHKDEPTPRLEAHAALGPTLFHLGAYAEARTHLEQGIALTDLAVQRVLTLRHDVAPGIQCLALTAFTLWCLGKPAQAVRRSQEALALAQELAHPQSLAFAQHCVAFLHQRRREAPAVQAHADALLTLATAQGFPLYVGWGACWRGWALAMQGQGEAGLAQLRQGMAALMATGQTLSQPLCLVLLAEAAGHTGQVEEGLRLLSEAQTAFEATGRGDMLAEAYRLQGELLLQQAALKAAQAETAFHQALAIARRQQAKFWELRAAMSLSRLWQQ
jgi:class 3 adenylate cyclase/predicted ATPase